MVDVVEWSYKGGEPMAHPAVDHVLKKGPGEEPRAEQSEQSDNSNGGTTHTRHIIMVKPRATRAQSACANRLAQKSRPATAHKVAAKSPPRSRRVDGLRRQGW